VNKSMVPPDVELDWIVADFRKSTLPHSKVVADAITALRQEIESLRAECGIRQIDGYNKGKAEGEAERAALREDAERLDWAESHPESFMRQLDVFWANAGRGFREEYFNVRGAIDAARKA